MEAIRILKKNDLNTWRLVFFFPKHNAQLNLIEQLIGFQLHILFIIYFPSTERR